MEEMATPTAIREKPYKRRGARTPVQLRITRKMKQAMKQRAVKEGMTFTAWVRHAALKELRRKIVDL